VLASLLDKIKEKVPGNGGEGNEENVGTGDENEGLDGNQGDGSEGTGDQNQGDNSGSGDSGTEGEEEISQVQPVTWSKNTDGTITSSIGETVEIGVTTYTTAQVLEKLGLEAQEGKYSGDWVVLGLDGTNLKLVSQTNLGTKVSLGSLDPEAIDNVDKDDEIYNSDNLNLEEAIWSWNHVVDTLDNATKEQTGITSARSITAEDLEAEDVLNITEEIKKANVSDYGKTYKYYLEDGKIYSKNIEVDNSNVDDSEEEWSERGGGICDTFVKWDKTIIDSTDGNKDNIVKLTHSYYYYNFTSEQKTKFANSLANGYYWLASPCVNCNANIANFNVCNVRDGYIFSSWLFNSDGDSNGNGRGVRAVVSI